jgi:hypothetical protein
MKEPTRQAAFGIALALALITPTFAQMNVQPTRPPLVTAENERWYQVGEPVMFAGNIYYPAGAAIHFNANEMVRSGSYRGIPVYSRTTIEPYSVVFVPIAGGLMQPYERPRTGDLAGTSGSSASALPVAVGSAGADSYSMLQAPAPPALAPAPVDEYSASPLGHPGSSDRRTAEPDTRNPSVGTAGAFAGPQPPLPVRPGAANGIFVEFENRRWFSSGPPVALNSRRLTRIGQFHDFPVYATGSRAPATIYIPIARGMDTVAPFSKRK